MKIIRRFISLVVLFLCADLVSAQEALTPVEKPLKVYDLGLFPNPKDYPVEITNTGAQGSVLLAIQINEEQKVTSAVVKETSRDEVLDALAVKFLLKPVKLGFKPQDNYSTSEIRITFTKDDPFKWKFKTCEDANIDGAYFKKMNPDKPVRDMRFWTSLSGLMFINYSSQKAFANSDLNKVLDDAIAECLAHPENNVFDTYFRVAKIKPMVR
jgi:TonB family protein